MANRSLTSRVRERSDDVDRRWRLWIDTGGTFTDCLAWSPQGELKRAKVLSSSALRTTVERRCSATELNLAAFGHLPSGFFRGAELRAVDRPERAFTVVEFLGGEGRMVLDRELPGDVGDGTRVEVATVLEAPLLAAHWVTRTPLEAELPAIEMRLATTRGTNALLEGKGSPTALFITRGFADLLEIGNQQRPDIFALEIRKRRPLYAAVVEVEERLDGNGEVLRPVDLEGLEVAARAVLDRGIRAAAVALLHSYRNAAHERAVAQRLRLLGFEHVSVSSDLAPLIKILPRAETAVVNAYLSEVIGEYLDSVAGRVRPGPLHVLTSSGGLVRAEGFAPKDSLLSGPAGGVVGAATVARRSGYRRCLAFDMGGTSTDVSRYDGDYDYEFETRVGEAVLLSPALAIETVAAGGGSICHFDGRQLKVGPESAGASPGPACYGAGGPLTLTDVNLLLGRLHPGSFEIPIDAEASARALANLEQEIRRARTSSRLDRDQILSGFLAIADERMAEAVRRISIRQGYRPGDYALVAFGGAGGQHACALAAILGIGTILVPQDAGLLSAVGLGGARVERMAERQVLQPLSRLEPRLSRIVAEVREEARAAVIAEGIATTETEVRRTLVYLRLAGQESTLEIDFEPGRSLIASFLERYDEAYGYRPDAPEVEVESVRVLVASRQRPESQVERRRPRSPLRPATQRSAFVAGQWRPVPVYWRSDLSEGGYLSGPALVFEEHCATLVEASWSMEIDASCCMVLERRSAGASETSDRERGGRTSK